MVDGPTPGAAAVAEAERDKKSAGKRSGGARTVAARELGEAMLAVGAHTVAVPRADSVAKSTLATRAAAANGHAEGQEAGDVTG